MPNYMSDDEIPQPPALPPSDLDVAVMSFATRLRVAGAVEDAEQVESCAATLRETPRSVNFNYLYDALNDIVCAAQTVADLYRKHVPFKP